MTFFQRQRSARRLTQAYIVQLWLLAIPCLVAMLLATLFSVWPLVTGLLGEVLGWFMGERASMDFLMHPVVFAVSLLLYTAIVFCVLVRRRHRQLSGSSDFVANQLNAVAVTRRSAEPGIRRLGNVAEEMALAAGIPAPAMYVWPDDDSINALTVGHNSADAAMFVSRGAVRMLSRDEMQALLAYGTSQILNGDMALNVRLSAYVYALNFAPRVAKWWLFFPSREKGVEKLKAILAWLLFALWIGLFLSAISFPLYLAARLLQSSIGRERQKLADASMMQFTRNPDGVRGVLAKALAFNEVSKHPIRIVEDMAHACFVSPRKVKHFDTHLPLRTRLKTLDPRFDFSSLPALGERLRHAIKSETELPVAESREQAEAQRRTDMLETVNAAVVTLIAAQAASQEASAPTKESKPSVTLPDSAVQTCAVLFALVLDARRDVRHQQLAAIKQHFPQVAEMIPTLGSMPPVQRTLALDRHLPALRSLDRPQLQSLLLALRDAELADDRVDVFEYAAARYATVFIRDLLEHREPHGRDTLDRHLVDAGTLLSVVATHGGREAKSAYVAGVRSLGLTSAPSFVTLTHWTRALDTALERLERLRPMAKELLLEGLEAMVAYDREITPAERELVRVIAATLHCPRPREVSAPRSQRQSAPALSPSR